MILQKVIVTSMMKASDYLANQTKKDAMWVISYISYKLFLDNSFNSNITYFTLTITELYLILIR